MAIPIEQVVAVIVLIVLRRVEQEKRPPIPRNVEKGDILRHQLQTQPTVLWDVCSVRPLVFNSLLQWIRYNSPLRDSRQGYTSVSERLAIFLCVCRSPGYSTASKIFGRSKGTINAAFYQILPALVVLHQEVVLPPEKKILKQLSDPKYKHFKDCIGAVDGTHIPAWIPQDRQGPWRNRKGTISQNVFAACSFDMRFTHIHAGWEGSAHDVAVMKDSIARGRWQLIPQRYYLADAGFSNYDYLLVPYAKVRYHLREWDRAGKKPETKQELFNLRHSAKRNVIERIFGVLKKKFPIFKQQTQFSITTQVELVQALTAVYNFILLVGGEEDKDFSSVAARIYEEPGFTHFGRSIKEEKLAGQKMNDLRNKIAQRIWDDWQAEKIRRSVNTVLAE